VFPVSVVITNSWLFRVLKTFFFHFSGKKANDVFLNIFIQHFHSFIYSVSENKFNAHTAIDKQENAF